MSARYDNISSDASTGIQELIPDLVRPEVVATASRQEVFMPLVRRFDLTGPGANFTVPQAGALSWGTLTIDGTEPVDTAFNTAARTLTPVPHYLDVTVPITAYNAAQVSVREEVAKEAGIGLATYRDGLFAALYAERPTSTPDHLIGTDAVPLSFADLRDGYKLLLTQNAPKRYAWVVHPTQFAELLQDNTFIDASVKGSPVLTQGIGMNGFATSVLDIDVYVSDQIDESSGLHSMMFSKNAALAYGFKRIMHPVNGGAEELMVDIEWDATRRTVEVNMTIEAHAEGAKGTSATTNTWLVDIIS